MKIRQIGAVTAASVLALGLTACGDSAKDSGTGGGGGSKFKVGIKFDQPGLGLKEGSKYTGLDVDVATYVAKEGMTMVVVTHEMGFARKAANRVVFMADGQIVEENTPDEFFTQARSERARDFLSKILSH